MASDKYHESKSSLKISYVFENNVLSLISVPMFKRVLNKCRPTLVEDMDFDSMCDYLISKEVFTMTKFRDIKVWCICMHFMIVGVLLSHSLV